MITAQQLKKIYIFAATANIEKYLQYINEYTEQFEVNTPLRMSAFLAQIGHESGQLRYVQEIASGKAYEGRKDLGNVFFGDGVRYKGRGLIQITGRANYQSLSNDLGVDFINEPEKLQSPQYAVLSAFWFWDKKNLNKWADIPDFEKITRIINGGLNGYKDRLHLYELAKNTL